MNTLIKYLGISGLLLGTLVLLTPSAGALTIASALTPAYEVSLTDPTTGAVSIGAQGTESKKVKVLTLCRAFQKTKKNAGIRCVWGGKTIYTKKVRMTKKVTSSTLTPPKEVLPPAETRVFDGYIDGRIVVTEKEYTKARATETCALMMRANPASEVMCRWGDIVLDTRLITEAKKSTQVELMKSSVVASSGSYLMRNREQEIGIFALKSGSGNADARIESIALSNLGSTRLRKVVDSDVSARIVDADTGRQIIATALVSDTAIVFSKMEETLTGGSTRNYKILLSIANMEGISDGTTIELTLDPANIRITKKSDASPMSLIGGPLTMKSYIIGKSPPTMSVKNIAENTFRIKLTNTDENYPITVTRLGMSSSLALPIGNTYVAIACLRDMGINQACNTNGSTTLAVPGSSGEISLVGSTLTSSIGPRTSLEYDLYISSESIFPTTGQTSITIESLTYTIDERTLTERFPNTPTSRSSYRK